MSKIYIVDHEYLADQKMYLMDHERVVMTRGMSARKGLSRNEMLGF